MSPSPPYVIPRRRWAIAWSCSFFGVVSVALSLPNLVFFLFITHRGSSLAAGIFGLTAGAFAIWAGRYLWRQLRRLQALHRELAELRDVAVAEFARMDKADG